MPNPGVFLSKEDCIQLHDSLLGIYYSLSINVLGGDREYPLPTENDVKQLDKYVKFFGELGEELILFSYDSEDGPSPWPKAIKKEYGEEVA